MKLLSPGHTMCAGCGIGVVLNLVSQAVPKETVVSMATSCLEVCTTPYPLTAWNCPAIHVAFETTSAVASGITRAAKYLGKGWKVIAIAGDGGTFDIGLQALSGMLERGEKVTQICLDNEAYMNTGIQRSGATPWGAWTTTSQPGEQSVGKAENKKPIMDIVAAHRIPYAATAAISSPGDFVEKVKKALEMQPSFLHVYSPCPTGWKMESNMTVRISDLAIETGVWPLYEIENGQLRFTKRLSERLPVEEYLKLQGRFKHLTPEQIVRIQENIDAEWKRLEKIESCGI